jgi:hypothetical protein
LNAEGRAHFLKKRISHRVMKAGQAGKERLANIEKKSENITARLPP